MQARRGCEQDEASPSLDRRSSEDEVPYPHLNSFRKDQVIARVAFKSGLGRGIVI